MASEVADQVVPELDLPELFRQVRPAVILSRRGIPAEDAEDVLNDVVVQLLRKRSTIREPAAWLRGALANECQMYWRTRRRRLTVAVDQAVLDGLAGGVESDAERRVLRRNLSHWIGLLSWKCRELLKMRYNLELEDAEVAERMGYKPSSIDRVTRRCVAALGRKIAAGAAALPEDPR
jgi:RNA polymerase sigma factor (sigma-70 family)